MHACITVSLIPRAAFSPPILDRLQYANAEGEGLITCSKQMVHFKHMGGGAL